MIKDLYEVHSGSEFESHSHDAFTNPNINPVTDILKRAEYKYHYRPEESALYHPIEKSSVKLRNNGSVDIFTKDETGTRMDRESQVTNEFANDKKAHIFNYTEWLTGDYKSFVKGHRTLKANGRTQIHSGQDMTLDTDKDLYIIVRRDQRVTVKGDAYFDFQGNLHAHMKKDAKLQIDGDTDVQIKGDAKLRIDGNVDAKIERHAKIEVDGDVDVRGGNDILLKADRDITIDAGRHLHTIWRCPDPSHYDSDKKHK